MRLYGSLCVLIGPCVSLINPCVFLWVLIGFDASLCVAMCHYGSLYVFIRPYGF